jgi:hypothetical protein
MHKSLVFIVLLFAHGLAWAATYLYTGPLYTSTGGIYNTSMRITGQFTTAAPLAPNLPSLTEIGPLGLNLVTSWSFTDGVTTFTNANSIPYYNAGNGDFRIATDAGGNITTFWVGLQKPLPPNVAGTTLMDAFNIRSSPALYSATHQSLCTALTSGACTGFADPGTNFGSAATVGSFVYLADSQPVPTLSSAGLIAMLGVFTLVSLVAFSRRKQDA